MITTASSPPTESGVGETGVRPVSPSARDVNTTLEPSSSPPSRVPGAGLDATQLESGGSQAPGEPSSDLDFLPVDVARENRAMLELLPVGQSFDPATTAAWLNTVEVSAEVDERYRYTAADGGVGADGAELGRGGTGRVLLAHDRHLGREVALKELLPELNSSPGRRNAELRFVREARIAGQLEHPNVVTVYDMGRRPNGSLYYTMKVVRGRTLASALQAAEGLDARLALMGHVLGLCQALAYAHSKGVIHRDIKPDNVMIGEFGETVVLDWGGARVTPTKASSALFSSIPPHPEKRRWIGTPLYMSPEQIAGRVSEVDERSDVWALGVVLYQVLTGRFPFGGKSFSELGKNISLRALSPVCDVEPLAPAELAAIAERALCKNRSQRYGDAREMMQDIEAYRSGGHVTAYTYSRWELGRRFLMRHRTALLLTTLLVVALLSLLLEGQRLAGR